VIVLGWVVTAVVITIVALFIWYLFALRRLPTAKLITVARYDRLGRPRDQNHPEEPARE
jgi:hypothetical protein